MIKNLQNSDAQKIHLTFAIYFNCSKGAEEKRVMHSSSGNIKFTPYSDANDGIDKLSHFVQDIKKIQKYPSNVYEVS